MRKGVIKMGKRSVWICDPSRMKEDSNMDFVKYDRYNDNIVLNSRLWKI